MKNKPKNFKKILLVDWLKENKISQHELYAIAKIIAVEGGQVGIFNQRRSDLEDAFNDLADKI